MSIEDRMKALADEHFGIDVDLDAPLPAVGISSLDKLAFVKLAAKEFQLDMSKLEIDQCENLRALVNWIDNNR